MEDFIIYIAKSGICLGIFLLVYYLFLRRTTFFRFNRFYLLTGLIASFILPLLHYTYEVQVNLPLSLFQTETTDTAPAVEASFSIGIENILFCVALSGIFIQLLLQFNAYSKFRKLLREGYRNQEKAYCLVSHPDIKSPFSVFKYIFINSSKIQDAEKDSILKHELTHITQRHWIDLFCSQLALMLEWFNPLMWLYIRCQKENHEFLADEAVLAQGISPALYQATLINQKFQARVFAFGHPFYYKPLNRLKMMKKAKTRPWKKAVILLLVPAFGTFFHAFAETRYVVEYTATGTEQDNKTTVATNSEDDTTKLAIGFEELAKMPWLNKSVEEEPVEKPTVDVLNDENQPFVDTETAIKVRKKGEKDPLVIVDGKEYTIDFNSLDPETIESITVFKDSAATSLYGDKAKYGAVIIDTKTVENSGNTEGTKNLDDVTVTGYGTQKKSDNQTRTPKKPKVVMFDQMKTEDMPLIMVDGKPYSKGIESIRPETIKFITVLKDSAAVSQYGEKAKKGIILIELKKDSETKDARKEIEQSRLIMQEKRKEINAIMQEKQKEMKEQ